MGKHFQHNILLISFFLTIINSFAQLGFEYNNNITVIKNGDTLQNPWAGGLNYPQFSKIDYNFDGKEDLFIFDRSSDNIRIFKHQSINGQDQWVFDYYARELFPTDFIYRATSIDYNQDGKNDLFTYGIGGLKVYQNTGNSNTGLNWELVHPIVYSNYNGFKSNLYIASSDIPAIIDVDGDGDLDILTFHQGGQHLEYHKNMSMENYGIPDSLEFVLANECWGKFAESETDNSVILNATHTPCEGGNLPNPEQPIQDINPTKSENQRHTGSTVLALDYNNSGVMDLILGDVSYDNLILLINGGSSPNSNSAMVSVETNFPTNSTQASITSFPAAYFLDVNFDGKRDLLVAPNAKNISQNEKSVLYYQNIGTDYQPIFDFKSTNFLQNQMIEHGKGSIPVIYDVDGDGLKDLLISNIYRYNQQHERESTISYYKNTGTISYPVFTHIDSNWQNITQYNLGFRIAPSFGDINNDGKDEMIIGNEAGNLYLLEKVGNHFTNPTLLKDHQNNNITTNGSAFPQLFDLNQDGKLDLIIGNRNGNIAYYENIGTAQSPTFQLKNPQLGGIHITSDNFGDGYVAPHFFKHNNSIQLFIGSADGKIHYYNNIENKLSNNETFNLVSNQFLNINTDAFSTLFVSDINNNNLLNLFVGQDLGGVFHFEVNPNNHTNIEHKTFESNIQIYPNPFDESIKINNKQLYKLNIKIYNIEGQLIIEKQTIGDSMLDTKKLTKGMYIIEITNEQKERIIQKVFKE